MSTLEEKYSAKYFVDSKSYRTFALNLEDMEEKRYPVIEDEEGIGMAREPIGSASLLEYTEMDNDFEPDMPIVIPASYEEALADIEQSEKEFKEGRGIPWENVKLMIEDHIRSYAH